MAKMSLANGSGKISPILLVFQFLSNPDRSEALAREEGSSHWIPMAFADQNRVNPWGVQNVDECTIFNHPFQLIPHNRNASRNSLHSPWNSSVVNGFPSIIPNVIFVFNKIRPRVVGLKPWLWCPLAHKCLMLPNLLTPSHPHSWTYKFYPMQQGWNLYHFAYILHRKPLSSFSIWHTTEFRIQVLANKKIGVVARTLLSRVSLHGKDKAKACHPWNSFFQVCPPC